MLDARAAHVRESERPAHLDASFHLDAAGERGVEAQHVADGDRAALEAAEPRDPNDVWVGHARQLDEPGQVARARRAVETQFNTGTEAQAKRAGRIGEVACIDSEVGKGSTFTVQIPVVYRES